MITFNHRGNFKNTERFLSRAQSLNLQNILKQHAEKGVNALSAATPVDTGLTAQSWEYRITITRTSCKITWINTNMEYGAPVAVLIQYGHGTGNGGYVQGIDYVNPAMKPIFDEIADILWREVQNL